MNYEIAIFTINLFSVKSQLNALSWAHSFKNWGMWVLKIERFESKTQLGYNKTLSECLTRGTAELVEHKGWIILKSVYIIEILNELPDR